MGTEIKTWQIVDGKLQPIDLGLVDAGRTEPYDLEPWLASNPEIIGHGIVIIGQQVMTRSGPVDLLGIDSSGNIVVIELKRDRLPREALAQAIDYASDIAEWNLDKLSEVCTSYSGKTLEEMLIEAFPDVQLESISVNETQRLVLVGFSLESSLERMIEWLTDNYNVNVNAVVLTYVKTVSGDELLAKTSIISEESEITRVKKQKKFEIPMSDESGAYERGILKQRLLEYLNKPKVTNQRIRDILLPACLTHEVLTRDQLKNEFVAHDPGTEKSKVGYYVTVMSSQLGMTKNDFLRQVISYEYPTYKWEKDNFAIRPEYRDLITQILEELKVAQQG
ncbi:MAG: endonuclease NucS [Chloroflexi bacterium]|nr:endonuclease NucS [Chloroflexota bacterium]